MFTLNKLTGKPPPHHEIQCDEKWGKLELLEGIPINARISVREKLAPLNLKIGYDNFFFKGLSNSIQNERLRRN